MPTAKLLNRGGALLVAVVSASLTACPDAPPPTLDRLSTLPDMSDERLEHAATLLDDGRVLIIGGGAPKTNQLTVELYDPDARAFEEVLVMASEHDFADVRHSLTTMGDGRVLAIGGSSEFGAHSVGLIDLDEDFAAPVLSVREVPIGSPEVLALGDDRLLLVQAFPCHVSRLNYTEEGLGITCLIDQPPLDYSSCGEHRCGPSAALASAREVLVYGAGSEAVGVAYSDRAELVDLEANTTRVIGPMAAPRGPGPAISLGDGRVLLVGDSEVPLELFELDTESFVEVPSELPMFSRAGAIRLDDGRVLIAGGLGGRSGPSLSQVALFDPASDSVTRLDVHLAPARHDPVLVKLADGRVLITGGAFLDENGIEYEVPWATLFE